MFFKSTEVNIELVEMLKQSAKKSPLSHHSKSIHILWKTLATIAELTIRTKNVGVSIVDVA